MAAYQERPAVKKDKMAYPPRIEEEEKRKQKPKAENAENVNAIPPKPTSPQDETNFWVRMDNLFFDTVEQAKSAFTVNKNISILVVIVGCAILGYSMIYSWTKSLDLYSTAFGTLGVASFIATFFIQPQNLIQKNVGDLTQIQMCYRTYCIHWEAVVDWERNNQKTMTIKDIEKMSNHTLNVTKELSKLVESMVGEEPTKKTTAQSVTQKTTP